MARVSAAVRHGPLVLGWARRNVVVTVSTVLALASCILVRPDREYVDYLDVRTLVTLFCMLAVVRALQELHVLEAVSQRLVSAFGHRRSVVLVLVWVTLVGSMLVTNDMALIAFLPLAHIVLSSTGNSRYVGFVFIMQTAAANLGGMITPFGSPQNLYLYSFYDISLSRFLAIMAVPFVVSVVAITVITALVRNAPLASDAHAPTVPAVRAGIAVLLLLVTVLVVLRVVPLWTSVLVPLVLLVVDRRAIAKVDYALMATFLMFFVFSGNLSRLPAVSHELTSLLDGDVLLWSILGSQVISNVPTALLFSQFTDNYAELLVGVNVGGVGTLIGSLASLIALAELQKHQRERTWWFVGWFTVVNVGLLVLLTVVAHVGFDLGWIPAGER
jgi:Na+/H+ antiporter NhaD/arsenite permease-like protein